MAFTVWLESKVKELECEIRSSGVFESTLPTDERDLQELKKRIVLHRYLTQALERRQAEDRASGERRRSGEFALEALTT